MADVGTAGPRLVQAAAAQECCNAAWEEAYRRFETPEEEVAKFLARFRLLGAEAWPRTARIVDLCCGQGNGLAALARLGFATLAGVDLSASLLGRCQAPATLYVADCRALPFAADSQDVVVVQGGLHHLPRLPEDLERTLDEARRVLVPGGRFVAVEPWRTPYLTLVHALCSLPPIRWLSGKADALATMIAHERATYFRWLAQPDAILAALGQRFDAERRLVRWGKLLYVGRKPA